MPASPCEILLNDLRETPHTDGQQVFHVRSGTIEVEIRFNSGLYRIYGFIQVKEAARRCYISLDAETPGAARDKAAAMIRERAAG